MVDPQHISHVLRLEFPVSSPLPAEKIPLILPFEGEELGD
jgi:hypothetical protein